MRWDVGTSLGLTVLVAAALGATAPPAAPSSATPPPPPDAPADARDWPMYGGTPQRNMVSPHRGAPTDWEVGETPGACRNVKWQLALGSQSYGGPIVCGGVVYVGTNNEARLDPREQRDGGVLVAIDARTGQVLWQRYRPKLPAGRVNDWPYQGQCGPVYAEPGRLWYCTNRCEAVCLDVSHPGREPKVLWSVDMMAQLGVYPHNMTRTAPVAWGDWLYVITGNGVDETHRHVSAPGAPAVVCFNKNTGAVVWTANPPGNRILHGQWSSVAVAAVNGRGLVLAPLGDGWVYALDAASGRVVWKFDTNLKDSVYPRTRNEILATPVIYNQRMYLATGQDPEHGEGPGHLWCVDITKSGDVSLEREGNEVPAPGDVGIVMEVPQPPHKGVANPNSAVVWHYDKADLNGDGKIRADERMNRSIATVAIANNLVFAADFSGYVHCFDADTGEHYWAHDMEAAIWEGPLVADGRVYAVDEDGDVTILAASKERKEIATRHLPSSIYTTPVFADGVLYVLTKDRLFAIGPNAAATAAR